jgi:Protein of unknown function (DUF2874).
MNTTELKGNWNEQKGKLKKKFAVFKPNNLLIMKKVLLVLVLIMAVLVVNAQATTTKTTVTKEKGLRTVVLVADLQKAITDNIAKDYVGYTIKEATSVTANSIVTYEVVIVKGTATETLVYDKDGVFVKKLPVPTTPKMK